MRLWIEARVFGRRLLKISGNSLFSILSKISLMRSSGVVLEFWRREETAWRPDVWRFETVRKTKVTNSLPALRFMRL